MLPLKPKPPAGSRWFTIILWSISAFVFVVVGAGIAGVAKGVIQPIVRMTGVMQRLAGGELESDIPSLGRKDEVGAMASCRTDFQGKCRAGSRHGGRGGAFGKAGRRG